MARAYGDSLDDSRFTLADYFDSESDHNEDGDDNRSQAGPSRTRTAPRAPRAARRLVDVTPDPDEYTNTVPRSGSSSGFRSGDISAGAGRLLPPVPFHSPTPRSPSQTLLLHALPPSPGTEPSYPPRPHGSTFLEPTRPLGLSPSFDLSVDDDEKSFNRLSQLSSDNFHDSMIHPPPSLVPEKRDTESNDPDGPRDGTGSGPIRPVGYDSRWQRSLKWLRRLIPSSMACRLLLITVLLETFIDIAIEANILWRFNLEVDSTDSTELETENKRRLPVYLCIFGLAHLWQFVLTVDAIRTRNTVQVIGLAIFNGMFLIYAGFQISEIRSILGSSTPAADSTHSSNSLLTLPLNVLTSIVIGVIAISQVLVMVLTWFIWREFGWRIYRFLGADLRIRKYYFQYQVFDCICRFSAFFFAGFGIQFIFLVLNKTDPEYIITWIMLPLSLLFLILGIFAARYEKSYLMAIFIVGLVCGVAYFIYKLIRIWQDTATTYAQVYKTLTVFSALSLFCIGLCIAWGIIVWRNFGRGLKQHVVGTSRQEDDGVDLAPTKGAFSSLHSATGNLGSQRRLSIE